MARKKSTPALISRPEVIAFLREIKDNPEDDTPRLILADWLDDRGDPRGEFIRLDMQLAATGACDARHAEIRKQHEADWLGPLAAKATWSYTRGLLNLEVDQYWIQRPSWRRLAGSELWEWVEGLTLKGCTSSFLNLLVDSPLLPSVSSLVFGSWEAESERFGLPRLLGSQALRGLRSLDLGRSNWLISGQAEAVRAIRESAALTGLRKLRLSCVHASPAIAQLLTTSANLAGLEELDFRNHGVSGPGIGPEGMRHIADSPFLGRLRVLKLPWQFVLDEGVAILAESPHLAHIEELDLSHNHLTDAAVERLTQSRHLGRLKRLDLSDNALGERSIVALDACDALSEIHMTM